MKLKMIAFYAKSTIAVCLYFLGALAHPMASRVRLAVLQLMGK